MSPHKSPSKNAQTTPDELRGQLDYLKLQFMREHAEQLLGHPGYAMPHSGGQKGRFMNEEAMELTYRPVGTTGKVSLTVKVGGEVIAQDKVDMLSAIGPVRWVRWTRLRGLAPPARHRPND